MNAINRGDNCRFHVISNFLEPLFQSSCAAARGAHAAGVRFSAARRKSRPTNFLAPKSDKECETKVWASRPNRYAGRGRYPFLFRSLGSTARFFGNKFVKQKTTRFSIGWFWCYLIKSAFPTADKVERNRQTQAQERHGGRLRHCQHGIVEIYNIRCHLAVIHEHDIR